MQMKYPKSLLMFFSRISFIGQISSVRLHFVTIIINNKIKIIINCLNGKTYFVSSDVITGSHFF